MARFKIEEIILICVSLFFLVLLFSGGFFANDVGLIFKKGLSNIVFFFPWLANGLVWGVCFLLIRNYQEKTKNFLKQILSLLKTMVIIAATAALGILTTGAIQQEAKNQLVSPQLLNADKLLTKKYLLFWFHSSSGGLKGFFDFLTPAVMYSFLGLGAIMVVLAFIFYFEKNKNLFKGYIISMFVVFALAMPLWRLFPANSPANYLLHGSGGNFNAELSRAIIDYRPNPKVMDFQEKIWQEQKNAMPITTMPSMHWAWSIIIVYYLFKKWRRTIFLSSVWLSFNLFGTVYLGNHYLVDGLVAIPLAVLSLLLANLLIKLEQGYYKL